MKSVTDNEALWRIVPVEPNYAMFTAFALGDMVTVGRWRERYTALLAAAPLPAPTAVAEAVAAKTDPALSDFKFSDFEEHRTFAPPPDTEARDKAIADLEELTFAVQHQPNCPSPWLVRLIGKGAGALDMQAPAIFANGVCISGPGTRDVLGYGKTFAEAASAAIEALKGGQ